jgi:hypothetical protein
MALNDERYGPGDLQSLAIITLALGQCVLTKQICSKQPERHNRSGNDAQQMQSRRKLSQCPVSSPWATPA